MFITLRIVLCYEPIYLIKYAHLNLVCMTFTWSMLTNKIPSSSSILGKLTKKHFKKCYYLSSYISFAKWMKIHLESMLAKMFPTWKQLGNNKPDTGGAQTFIVDTQLYSSFVRLSVVKDRSYIENILT